jgi:hypothetical protein
MIGRSMPGSPDHLRLPKIPVTVELALAGGGVRAVEVFVAEHKEHAYRRQRVLDLLDEPAPFLPARDPARGVVTLVNKGTLMWVAISLDQGALPVEEEPEVLETQLYEVRQRAEVELVDGTSLLGDLMYTPPAEQARTTDHLNRAERFFRLWAADRVYLINKSFVRGVTDLADSDAEATEG